MYEEKQIEEFDRQMELKLKKIDEEYEQQFESFQKFWVERTKHYEIEANELLQKTIQENEKNSEDYLDVLNKKFSKEGKMSSKYLDLLYRLKQMSKAQRFREAAKIQEKLVDEFNRCMKRNKKNNLKKIEKLLKVFQKKQLIELKSLQQKIDLNHNELLKSKEQDYDKIIKKYKVNKSNEENKIKKARVKKLQLLKAFDPEKNINVSNIYSKDFDKTQDFQENERVEYEEENSLIKNQSNLKKKKTKNRKNKKKEKQFSEENEIISSKYDFHGEANLRNNLNQTGENEEEYESKEVEFEDEDGEYNQELEGEENEEESYNDTDSEHEENERNLNIESDYNNNSINLNQY